MVPRQLLVPLFLLQCVHFLAGSVVMHENCRTRLHREPVFSVPGDVAMLNSTLLSPNVFNYAALPYNISWYDPLTEMKMVNQTGRFLLRGETLWLLNVTLEDARAYTCVVRTPSGCFHQAITLVVDPPLAAGVCGRLNKAPQQPLIPLGNDLLTCPLTNYISKLNSYGVAASISWYKGCSLIADGGGRFTYGLQASLKLSYVSSDDAGSYTCTLTFDLAGVTGSVSETMNAEVKEGYVMPPEIYAPANEVIKAQIGSSFSKLCRVFVPSVGSHNVRVMWTVNGDFAEESPSERVHAERQLSRSEREEGGRPGSWEERLLQFREVWAEDVNSNYTCRTYSPKGNLMASFSLLPSDTNQWVTIVLSLAGGAGLFVSTVVFYFLFKLDVVLWFRRAFPVFYRNTESDGKPFDAYVMFPRHAGKAVESFALQALPLVLERRCGHKLFIPGRDCLPGHALVDSLEENMRASHRLILIYTASTFTGCHDGNDNSNRDGSETSTSCNDRPHHASNTYSSSSHGDGNIPSAQNTPGHTLPGHKSNKHGFECQLSVECQIAMHRALLEESLKVLLVEMEEVGPDQLALFPASVLHLRKRQGALCWWKSQRRSRVGWGRCGGRDEEEAGEEEEKGRLESGDAAEHLSPSSRFWKQMRYHMPVRGKRTAYPEKISLLNL